MHRTDGDANVAGMYSEGDPGVPTPPTQLTPQALNALQEEIAKTIEGAGLTLRASGAADEGAGYASQLLEAIRALIPVKAWARLTIGPTGSGSDTTVRVDAGYGVASAEIVQVSGNYSGVRITFSSTFGTPRQTKRLVEAYRIASDHVNIFKTDIGERFAVTVYDNASMGGVALANNQIGLQLDDNVPTLITDLRGSQFEVFVRVSA